MKKTQRQKNAANIQEKREGEREGGEEGGIWVGGKKENWRGTWWLCSVFLPLG